MTQRRTDSGASEDVVQEAFLVLWKNARGFNASRGTVRAYLLTSVRNRCIDIFRGPRRALEKYSLGEATVDVAADDHVLESVLKYAQAEDVRRALLTLPQGQRETVELAFFKGLTQAQIAAQTQTPLGTVKGRMRRALEMLHEILIQQGGMKTATEV